MDNSVMMTEREVRSIIEGYNTSVEEFMKESEVAKEKAKGAEDKYLAEVEAACKAQENVRGLKQEQACLQARKMCVQERLDELDHMMDLHDMKANELREPLDERLSNVKMRISTVLEKLRVQNPSQSEVISQYFSSYVKTIEETRAKTRSLKSSNYALDQENEHFQKVVTELHEEEDRERQCLKCQKPYRPKDNKENNCLHHPGQMKFYSCRGCGGDKYYVCCNRCSTCCQGCKVGTHVG